MMKNLHVQVPELLLQEVRELAAKQNATVDQQTLHAARHLSRAASRR
jgi:hypothetical protein